MMTQTSTLYRQVVDVASDFFGPAAERFIARQIQTRLQKSPEELTAGDLDHLTDWIKLATALLTDDNELIDTFTANLKKLSERSEDSRA
jgi:hypothetical protein